MCNQLPIELSMVGYRGLPSTEWLPYLPAFVTVHTQLLACPPLYNKRGVLSPGSQWYMQLLLHRGTAVVPNMPWFSVCEFFPTPILFQRSIWRMQQSGWVFILNTCDLTPFFFFALWEPFNKQKGYYSLLLGKNVVYLSSNLYSFIPISNDIHLLGHLH